MARGRCSEGSLDGRPRYVFCLSVCLSYLTGMRVKTSFEGPAASAQSHGLHLIAHEQHKSMVVYIYVSANRMYSTDAHPHWPSRHSVCMCVYLSRSLPLPSCHTYVLPLFCQSVCPYLVSCAYARMPVLAHTCQRTSAPEHTRDTHTYIHEQARCQGAWSKRVNGHA
jgi:hypothetical protein